MVAITFDTLKFVHRLRNAGIPEPQAEAIAEAFQDASGEAEVATKSDVSAIRSDIKSDISEIRSDVKNEISAIRSDIKSEISAIRSDMEIMKRDLTIRLGGMIAAGVAFLTAIKFFGH